MPSSRSSAMTSEPSSIPNLRRILPIPGLQGEKCGARAWKSPPRLCG
jgi:hypothetical protein